MDRLSQLRGEAGGSRDSTLDTTSPPSEAYLTANESSSKYYSLSEVDSTFDISAIKDDISSIKDVSLASTAVESEGTITNTDELISNLSPIGKKSDILDSYKIDTQIEAANILSGGVAIFDDNDNSYDGDELVIDDNVVVDEKSNSELKQPESLQFKSDGNIIESSLNVNEEAHIASKDTEVVLQIDGNQVDAIDIGNGLYLYRKQDHEELAAVQINTDAQQQPNFKFLKVRENAEGNLEVYEEIEIEVPKEVPAKEVKMADKNTPSHVPIMDINKVISDSTSNKVADRKVTPKTETVLTTEDVSDNKESSPDKSEVNLNGKMMKFSESRKSPVIGSFTPMTYHSTPNKGVPLTKTMVDQQLHTNRHSDLSNVKKTIEVHTDGGKQKIIETATKNKDPEDNKLNESDNIETESATVELNEKDIIKIEERNVDIDEIKKSNDAAADVAKTHENKCDKIANDEIIETDALEKNAKPIEQEIIPDASDNVTEEKPQKNIQLDNFNKPKEQRNLSIVDEVTAQKEKEDEEARKNKNSSKISETIDEEVVQVEDLIEGKDEPMDIDDEIELTIAEPVPCVEERKEIVQDSNKIEPKDDEQNQLIVDKQEQNLVIVDDAILIEDDDVSIVEEVIVESKDNKNNIQENVASDSNKDAKLDSAKAPEILLKIDENDEVNDNKLIIEKGKDDILVVVSSVDSSVQPETKKDLCTTDTKKDIMDPTMEKETKKADTSASLPHQIEPAKDTIPISSTNTLDKVSDQESKEILVNPEINEIKNSAQALKLLVIDHDSKPMKTVDTTDVPKETIKHNIPTNISPLLDQKHPSLVTPKVNKENTVEEKVENRKTVSNIQNVNTSLEHKIENIILGTSSRKNPVNLIQVTESAAIVAQKRIDNNTVPQTVTPVVVKDKLLQKVGNTMEVSQKLSSAVGVPQKLTSALEVPQNLGSALEVPQKLCSALGVPQKLASSLEVPQNRGSALQVPQNLSSAVKVPQKLSSAVEVPQKLSSAVEVPQKLSSAVEVPQKLSSVVEVSQKPGSTMKLLQKVAEEVPPKVGNALALLQKFGSTVEAPQKISSTVEIPHKVASTVEVPQKVTSAVEVPQKVTSAVEVPQKVTSAVEVPQNVTSAVEVPQKVTSAIEVPQKCTSAVEVPQKVSSAVEVQKKVNPQPIKHSSIDKPQFTLESKRSYVSYKDDKKDIKIPPKEIASERGKGVMNIEITKVPKLDPTKTNVVLKQDASSSSSKHIIPAVKNRIEPKDKKELPKVTESKPINNNHAAAVPFGKWTEANRQEFLNKFKTKTSVISSNSNQLKNSNDLNRRDVLKKIDSQRQSSNALSKTQEANKLSMKPETAAFSNKPNVMNKEVTHEPKIQQKTETVEVKSKPVAAKNIAKAQAPSKSPHELSHTVTGTSVAKKEVCQRTGVVQNLIDKTIEGMIHRSVPAPKSQDEPKQTTNKEPSAPKSMKPQQTYPIEQATLDAIEMKMNELHGIPFIERPPHELPKVHKELKSYSKIDKEKPVASPKTKIPNLLPFPNKTQQKVSKDTVIEVDSDDEIIEHEPITGDINLNKKNQVVKPPTKEKIPSNITQQKQQEKTNDANKKDAIITEKDFDKFARRNSITYENCLTVNFDGKEPHNVVQTVVEKEICAKSYSRNDAGRVDSKAKLPYKYQNMRPSTQPAKAHAITKFQAANDDASNRNQSKLQKAYHSALTAKRQMAAECPITIIEDKPVKVVFIDNADYVPSQLNVQGQDLSPAKRVIPESDITVSTCDSLDSDILDSIDDAKSQDDTRAKTKHQRKQVLTPVDEPELELIEPSDLGIEVSPKKKRKTDDDRTDKNIKYPMRKKIYMLGSSTVPEDKSSNPVEVTKNLLKETVNLNDNGVAHKNTVSALDSLVKAAELIETQTDIMNTSIVSNPDNTSTTPVKRGRGRPRKYPLTPDGTVDKSKLATPSPQKKPRLIDAKVSKRDILTDDSDSEGEIIKENWTMGKINENIVCPICNKLFRTENVVFKHVKHCTGPSPSRSDSDKRSPRRTRISQDFDTKSRESKSDDMDIDDDKPLVQRKETPKKRKSKDSVSKSDDKDDVIVIEDTPIKEKPEKVDERKHHESRKPKTKIPHKNNDLVCEFCGKTFRQLSYLVNHKLSHKKQEKVDPKKTDKEDPKKTDKEAAASNKSVYSCEVCKKEFRKLHHLVQHRIIHNPSTVPTRSLRKSSSEQSESKIEKEPSTSKQSDDPSAGFRCEPCDKSFRKLHHLVEHRETHDGINRQKTTAVPPTKEEKPVEKPVILHQCDICKKTFKKLQLLNEHKEQHVETSSEKSDDKSVKSSLSTRDIIHECSLCYMVFPNEHSLNKHTIICQRKKRQSKQLKPADEAEGGDEVTESPTPEEKIECTDSPKPIFDNTSKEEKKRDIEEKVELTKDKPVVNVVEAPKDKSEEPIKVLEKEKNTLKLETKVSEQQKSPIKRDFVETEGAKTETISEVPQKIKKIEEKVSVKIHETPKKKTPTKDKTTPKRVKTTAAPPPVIEKVKSTVESSDDDDVRYMLNPNFKAEEVTEEKVFMNVRAKKRSSLQIERPNSKDLVKRRTSLQHPPKIPRLKPKAVEANTSNIKKETKTPKLEPVPSTDSDDSENVTYSFPSTIPEKPIKPALERTPKETERKIHKKSLADKRKSLSGIAKRKSLGKAVTARHKVTPLKPIKKRTIDAEHRCDCGQLFSSAALLSRHTTLAHTPPRIRRRRSPPPEEKPVIKPAPRKSSAAEKFKKSPASRKSSARSDSSTSTNTKATKSEVKPVRKSQVKDTESPSDSRKAKPEKSEAKSSVKPRRTGAHRGVPVPEKMRKLMQKK